MDVTLTFTDDETAALEWAIAHYDPQLVPDVATWLRRIVRGEVAAALTGYGEARSAALAAAVLTTDEKTTLADVKRAVDADLKKRPPPPKDTGSLPGVKVVIG